jgi:hypothetical protein
MSLASAMPSTSKRARSAPKMRSALSALLAQSGGSKCVAALITRRFSSAAIVRREAFQSQSATMITNAMISAAALNAPCPAHVAMRIACRFTSGERLGVAAFPLTAELPENRSDPKDAHSRQSVLRRKDKRMITQRPPAVPGHRIVYRFSRAVRVGSVQRQ